MRLDETQHLHDNEAATDFIQSLNAKLSHLFFDNLNELCDESLRLLQTRLKKSDVVWSYLEEVETALKYAEKCDEKLYHVEEEAA